MLYWTKYNPQNHFHDIQGKRKKFDNTIYTLDIESTNYLILNGKQIPAIEYLNLSEDERDSCEFRSCMYIWQFSINDIVYYGRRWSELESFLYILNNEVPELKYLFVHNLSFEFQFLKSVFGFEDVLARKARKVISAKMKEYILQKLPDTVFPNDIREFHFLIYHIQNIFHQLIHIHHHKKNNNHY